MTAQAKQNCSGRQQAQLFREADSPKSKASQNTAGFDSRPNQKRSESSLLKDSRLDVDQTFAAAPVLNYDFTCIMYR